MVQLTNSDISHTDKILLSVLQERGELETTSNTQISDFKEYINHFHKIISYKSVSIPGRLLFFCILRRIINTTQLPFAFLQDSDLIVDSDLTHEVFVKARLELIRAELVAYLPGDENLSVKPMYKLRG
ncbi:MAG: hypothetical protein ACRCZQ_10220 [Bacteroidales bacterium]